MVYLSYGKNGRTIRRNDFPTGSAKTPKKELDFHEISSTIRKMAFSCESADVFSCAFGNEFADRVEEYLKECIRKDK